MAFLRSLALITVAVAAAPEKPLQYYYCGSKTFSDTPVTVSRDGKFVTDISAGSKQNLTADPTSFVLHMTGCITPTGELSEAAGIEVKYRDLPNLFKGAVQNLPSLRMIRIEYCDVKQIHPGAFLEIPAIDSIFLRFNRIEEIHEGVFNELKVKKLFLGNNSIRYIHSGAFDSMLRLSLIDLDGNKLKTWNTDWFTNTPNVEHLSMDSNQLTKLPAHAFRKLKNDYATSIRLTNNQIVYIHPTAFQGLELLYALWLDHNHITNLDETVFLGFEKIYILSLTGNQVSCLSEDLLYSFRSPHMILHVEDNAPMNCECLRKIEKWAKTRNYFFTERYAKEECERKIERKFMSCK